MKFKPRPVTTATRDGWTHIIEDSVVPCGICGEWAVVDEVSMLCRHCWRFQALCREIAELRSTVEAYKNSVK